HYGGSEIGSLGGVEAREHQWHEQPFSAEVTLPPLGVVWLVPE
ncbi:MAG: alpha amylase C-terminal domain-containing protein, partial [Gaiellaceae bacterium]